MMEGANATILVGWSLSAILSAAALLVSIAGDLRRSTHLAAAALMVAAALALYTHDVMALPQICAALITGSAVGLALGRGIPRSRLPLLMGGLVGLAGVAAVLVGGAALRDPHAFGLLDDVTDRLRVVGTAGIGAGVSCGAMACGGAAAMLRGGRADRLHILIIAILLLAASGATAAFVVAPNPARLLACIGVTLVAGWAVTKRALLAGMGPALAVVSGFAGWAVAASAFLMENMPMVVAGGLAGAAGSLFGIRLCVFAERKGLAHAGRRP